MNFVDPKIRQLTDPSTSPFTSRCYRACNRFSYLWDRYRQDSSDANLKRVSADVKIENFAPVYDKWCLYCDRRDTKFKCGGCKSVYFCSKACQRNCWGIHKRHCGRPLFTVCITCGKDYAPVRCENCPIRYCSQRCRDRIHTMHQEIDCKNMAALFRQYMDEDVRKYCESVEMDIRNSDRDRDRDVASRLRDRFPDYDSVMEFARRNKDCFHIETSEEELKERAALWRKLYEDLIQRRTDDDESS